MKMLSQSRAAEILEHNGHRTLRHTCPLLIIAEYTYMTPYGDKAHIGSDVLPCDRGVLRSWMGY